VPDLYGSRKLSERQWDVTKALSEGMQNKEIAETLGISIGVVKNYLAIIRNRTGMTSRVDLALWYLTHEHLRYELH
jgi:DNA-binding NarL/FixJ family response regulator